VQGQSEPFHQPFSFLGPPTKLLENYQAPLQSNIHLLSDFVHHTTWVRPSLIHQLPLLASIRSLLH